jgi:PAS domain S-box-containing protein
MELDEELYILAINPAMKRSLGFLNETVVGMHISEILPAEILSSRMKWFDKAIQENKPIQFEDQRGGRYFHTVFVPNLETNRLLVIAIDITERILAEKQLAAHRNELEQMLEDRTQKMEEEMRERKKIERRALASQKMADLGLLTTGIAHELNSPLQGIMITSDFLLMKMDKGDYDRESFEERLEIIKLNVKRCAGIVDALRFYAHETPEELSPYDLDELIHSTLMLIRHQFQSTDNIEIMADIAENMPAFYCDRDRMMQVLINILTNARDAMPEGGTITIKADFHPARDEFSIRIIDTGHGIPDEIKNQVFTPFFSTKPVGKGTGLGLYIVSSIVRSRGGNIELVSEPGNGTTFVLTIPKQPINTTVPMVMQERFGYKP